MTVLQNSVWSIQQDYWPHTNKSVLKFAYIVTLSKNSSIISGNTAKWASGPCSLRSYLSQQTMPDVP